jgi:hypothetical protein
LVLRLGQRPAAGRRVRPCQLEVKRRVSRVVGEPDHALPYPVPVGADLAEPRQVTSSLGPAAQALQDPGKVEVRAFHPREPPLSLLPVGRGGLACGQEPQCGLILLRGALQVPRC